MEVRANILLVDDQSENLLALEAVLGDLNQNLVRASSGEEALRHCLHNEFAVIVLDVLMPGLDGFQTAALIRQRDQTRYTPIIFLTALDKGASQLRQSFEVGAVDYMVKPFAPEELRWKVSTFVDLYLKDRQREQLKEFERLSREFEAANALKMKFLTIVSHELRTPLASIKGFSSTALQDDIDWTFEQLCDYLRIIDEEADKLTHLVDQILDMTQLEAGTLHIKPRPESLKAIITLAMPKLTVLCPEHQLMIEIPEELPQVVVDSVRIAQVLTNLVANACKFSPAQTTIRLSAMPIDDFIQVSVVDEGSGFPEAEQQQVFEVFHQSEDLPSPNQTGLGLGLALSQRIIEAHGGTMWIETAPFAGGIVSFTLPTSNRDFLDSRLTCGTHGG